MHPPSVSLLLLLSGLIEKVTMVFKQCYVSIHISLNQGMEVKLFFLPLYMITLKISFTFTLPSFLSNIHNPICQLCWNDALDWLPPLNSIKNPIISKVVSLSNQYKRNSGYNWKLLADNCWWQLTRFPETNSNWWRLLTTWCWVQIGCFQQSHWNHLCHLLQI